MCPKCGVEETNGSGRMCRECWNRYMREYRRGGEKRARARGFAEGIAAARYLLYQEYSHMRDTTVRASDVAEMIRRRLERP
jgi:hypothetical protein